MQIIVGKAPTASFYSRYAIEKYWDEAFIATIYLINRLHTKLLDFSTPLEVLEKIKPDYGSMRIF
jgi:hypothetical protein